MSAGSNGAGRGPASELPATDPAVEQPATGEAMAPAPAPSAPAPVGADGLIHCAIVEERRTPEDCALLQQVVRGSAALKAPAAMLRGEQKSVHLAISRTAGSTAPTEALQDAPGVQHSFTPAVGRFIEARLIGDSGLEVTADPATPAVQDLGAGDGALWIWRVKAVDEGERTLTIQTRVMSRQPDGSFLPRGAIYTDTKNVRVTVGTGDVILDGISLFDRWLKALASPTESLTNLLISLGTLLGAVATLVAGIRTFGKRARGEADEKKEE